MSSEPDETEDPPTGVREPLRPKNPPNEGGAAVEPEHEHEPHELDLMYV